MVNEEREPTRTRLLKRFTNYFSFGMDARVGYDFNRYRSERQLFNYALYALVGFFNKFRKIKNIQDIVSKMSMEDEEILNGMTVRKEHVIFTEHSAAGHQ